MAIPYTYKGLQVFLDEYFFPIEATRDEIAKLLATHYPPKEGSEYPFDVADHPEDKIFRITDSTEVDGWDISREFYMRLPSEDVASKIASIIGGECMAEPVQDGNYDSLDEFILGAKTLGQ